MTVSSNPIWLKCILSYLLGSITPKIAFEYLALTIAALPLQITWSPLITSPSWYKLVPAWQNNGVNLEPRKVNKRLLFSFKKREFDENVFLWIITFTAIFKWGGSYRINESRPTLAVVAFSNCNVFLYKSWT